MRKLMIGLFFVFGLLIVIPVTAQAADYDLWVGGVRVTDDNKDNITGDGISYTDTEGKVSYDPGLNTLTLKNANITGVYKLTKYGIIHYKFGIYYNNIPLTVDLEGNNTLTIHDSPDYIINGIYSPLENDKELDIKGSGSLTINMGEAKGNVGIYCGNGMLTIGDNAEVTIIAGSTENSVFGIFCESSSPVDTYKLTIKDNARVNISGERIIYPIFSYGNILITDQAQVNAALGTSTEDSRPVYGIVGGKLTISGQSVVAVTGGNTSGTNSSSYGIFSYSPSITISDMAQVTAIGGSTSGTGSYSYGIHSDDIQITSATARVWAQGGTKAFVSQPKNGDDALLNIPGWDSTAPSTYPLATEPRGTHTFAAQNTGYEDQAPLSVNVINISDQPTGELTVALSGADADSFTLSTNTIDVIDASGTGIFTVAPVTGLGAGTYTATVTVSGDNGIFTSFDVSFTVTEALVYSISLDKSGTYSFPTKSTGYGSQTPLNVTVTNNGNQPTGDLTVSISGANANSFTLSSETINSIDVSATNNFTIVPVAGLGVGTYSAIVTVSGGNGISESFDVSFIVSRVTGGGSTGGSNSSGSTTPTLVTQINNGTSTTRSNLQGLVSEGKTLTVNGDKGAKLEFDTEALKGISSQTPGDIKVEVKDVSTEYQESLPDKMVFSLTVSSGSNTISNFGGKVTVSLPYNLKDGERSEDVTVWHIANDGTMTEIPCAYDPVTKLVSFTVTHFSLYVVGVDDAKPWVNPFTDVVESDWFYGTVEYVNKNDLFAGTGADTFSPNSPMTRAMLWTVLGRLDGQTFPSSGAFDGARIWAMGAGITDGTNPDGTITREQMITIMWRYADSPKANGDLSLFSDVDRVAVYATEAMAWAAENGIVVGSNGALMPKDNATRAQVAAFLQRFVEKVKK